MITIVIINIIIIVITVTVVVNNHPRATRTVPLHGGRKSETGGRERRRQRCVIKILLFDCYYVTSCHVTWQCAIHLSESCSRFTHRKSVFMSLVCGGSADWHTRRLRSTYSTTRLRSENESCLISQSTPQAWKPRDRPEWQVPPTCQPLVPTSQRFSNLEGS